MGGIYGAFGPVAKVILTPEEFKKLEIRKKCFFPPVIRALLGGRWPKIRNFDFNRVASFWMEKEVLVPYDNNCLYFSGPGLLLVMVDDVFSHPPKLIVPERFYGLPIETVAVDKSRKKERDYRVFPPEQVKVLSGGTWPEFHGFGFNCVEMYKRDKDMLIPCDSCGEPVPGPNFMAVLLDNAVRPSKIMLMEI